VARTRCRIFLASLAPSVPYVSSSKPSGLPPASESESDSESSCRRLRRPRDLGDSAYSSLSSDSELRLDSESERSIARRVLAAPTFIFAAACTVAPLPFAL
jgi:hypothetical protein